MTIRRKWPSRAIFGFMALYFVGGIIAFPNAPYSPCRAGYCDKIGKSHALIEYQHQRLWELGLIGVWPTGILALYLLNRRPQA